MNSIVVYFSRAGSNWVNDKVANLDIGNGEFIAKYVQKITKSDIFRIKTKHEYTNDYNTATREAKAELEENARPELIEYPENLSKYDTIYLIYPIWWDTCPMAVMTFLEHYDLTNKTIIPLCSHEGSGIANSVKDIKKHTKAFVKEAYDTRGYKCQNLDKDTKMQTEINNFLAVN